MDPVKPYKGYFSTIYKFWTMLEVAGSMKHNNLQPFGKVYYSKKFEGPGPLK